jgi:hypothetical protein
VRAFRAHFAQHTSHLVGCGAAALLVIAAILFNVPLLGFVGLFVCGAVMIWMAWMLVSTASKSGR